MIWDTIGVTGWTLPQITAMTMPQLQFIQRGRGRILYPRLEPMLWRNMNELNDEPGSKGEPSGVEHVLRADANRKAKTPQPLTYKEQRIAQAKRILLSSYLGHPEDEERERAPASTVTFPGMSVDEAQAWVAYVKSGKCPDFVWLEITDVYEAIFNTAKAVHSGA